jgi:cytoskeletal protein CcmA (bactofilin family)
MPRHSGRQHLHQIVTTLGKETKFCGVLRFKEPLRILGKFEGEIDSKGLLLIDRDSELKVKKIRAMSVIIGGTVYGDIEAVEKLELLSTAKVYGNIRTSKLRIADGVIFEGRCEMIDDAARFSPFAQEAH